MPKLSHDCQLAQTSLRTANSLYTIHARHVKQ